MCNRKVSYISEITPCATYFFSDADVVFYMNSYKKGLQVKAVCTCQDELGLAPLSANEA